MPSPLFLLGFFSLTKSKPRYIWPQGPYSCMPFRNLMHETGSDFKFSLVAQGEQIIGSPPSLSISSCTLPLYWSPSYLCTTKTILRSASHNPLLIVQEFPFRGQTWGNTQHRSQKYTWAHLGMGFWGRPGERSARGRGWFPGGNAPWAFRLLPL